MLQILSTKFLIAVLAALVVIAGVLIHIRNTDQRSTQLLQQQQDDAAAARQRDEETKEFVRRQHEKHSAYTTRSSETFKNFIP